MRVLSFIAAILTFLVVTVLSYGLMSLVRTGQIVEGAAVVIGLFAAIVVRNFIRRK